MLARKIPIESVVFVVLCVVELCFCACSFKREWPRYTAARECCEETLGILGSTSELAAALKDFKANNCFKVGESKT